MSDTTLSFWPGIAAIFQVTSVLLFFVAKNATVASYLLDSSIARFKKCLLLCVCQGSNKEWKHIAFHLSSLFVSSSMKQSQKFIFSGNFPALVTRKTSKFVTKETSLLLRQTPWHLLKPPIKGAFLWGDPIRISDPRSLGSWCIKGTDESTLVMDSSVPLMN